MTVRTRLPLFLNQKYFEKKDSIGLLLNKFDVIANSNMIIYAIRILIVMIALLLGYYQSQKATTDKSEAQKSAYHFSSHLPALKIK